MTYGPSTWTTAREELLAPDIDSKRLPVRFNLQKLEDDSHHEDTSRDDSSKDEDSSEERITTLKSSLLSPTEGHFPAVSPAASGDSLQWSNWSRVGENGSDSRRLAIENLGIGSRSCKPMAAVSSNGSLRPQSYAGSSTHDVRRPKIVPLRNPFGVSKSAQQSGATPSTATPPTQTAPSSRRDTCLSPNGNGLSFDQLPPKVLSYRTVERAVRVPKRIVTQDTYEVTHAVPVVTRREEIVSETHQVRERVIDIEQPITEETIVGYYYLYDGDSAPCKSGLADSTATPSTTASLNMSPGSSATRTTLGPPFSTDSIPTERIMPIASTSYAVAPQHTLGPLMRQLAPASITATPGVSSLLEDQDIVEEVVDEIVPFRVPVAVEAESTVQCFLPEIVAVQNTARGAVNEVSVPVYVPRFIEVACPADLVDAEARAELEEYSKALERIAVDSVTTFPAVERLAADVEDFNERYNLSYRAVLSGRAFNNHSSPA